MRRKLVQVADAGAVLLRGGPEGARELVVPVRLDIPPLLLEAAAERVVRVIVDGRQLEQRAELGLGLPPTADPEVRDTEGLADRGLVRLTPLRLLERNRRLRGHARPQMAAAALKEAVRRFAHDAALPTSLPSEADRGTATEPLRPSERREKNPRTRSPTVSPRRIEPISNSSSRRASRAATSARSARPNRAALAADTNADAWIPNSRRRTSPSSCSVALGADSTPWSARKAASSSRHAPAAWRGSRLRRCAVRTANFATG